MDRQRERVRSREQTQSETGMEQWSEFRVQSCGSQDAAVPLAWTFAALLGSVSCCSWGSEAVNVAFKALNLDLCMYRALLIIV